MKRVFHFNPACEMEVANRLPHFSPPKQVQNLMLDGQQLPAYFTQPEDQVIVKDLPSPDFLKGVKEFDIDSSVFLPKHKIQESPFQPIMASPWGWSPTMVRHFRNWYPTQENQFVWNPENETHYRRETAAHVLQQLIQSNNSYVPTLMPRICTHVSQVEHYLSDWGSIVIKAPLSSSGRGVQFLRKRPLNDSNKQWIQGVIDQQGSVMAEQMLDKVLDFSFHYCKQANGQVDFIGETAFLTNINGKYKGNYIGKVSLSPNFPNDFDPERLITAQQELLTVIEQHEKYTEFQGFLGIDMMIYKDEGELKTHPCVEINARQSMGLVSVHLQKWIKEGAKALFLVELKKDVDPDRFLMKKQDGKISKCYWPLSDYWRANQFVFMLKVE